MIWAN